MTAFIIRRLLAIVPVLFGVSIVVFLTLRLAPGDPAMAMLGPRATGEALADLRHWLGLDQPLHVQYLKWLSHAVRFDFGLTLFVDGIRTRLHTGGATSPGPNVTPVQSN